MPSRPALHRDPYCSARDRVVAALLAVALGISLPVGAAKARSADPTVSAASTAASAPFAGARLRDALDRLRRAGLDVVYSSALVDDSLVVGREPDPGSLADRAGQLLAEHRLELATIRPGRFAVVRQRATPAVDDVGTAAPPSPLEEVAVFASRYRIAAFEDFAPASLSRQQIDALPGIDEDALRVTRYLPGTATNGLSARANVRGGRDNELAVYFDDVPLYEPFHYKDFQALLGVLDPSAVAGLDFYSGVFPAQFGDRLSGVLDISPRLPAAGFAEHEIGVSLLYAHALSVGERKVRDRPVRWLASVRQSTVDLAIRAADRSGLDPHFLDVLLRAEWAPGDDDLLTGGLLWLDDDLEAQTDGGAERTSTSYRDRTSWVKWDHDFADQRVGLVVANSERHTDRSGSLQRPGSVTGQVSDDRESSASRVAVQWQRPDPTDGAASAGSWSAGLTLDRFAVDYDYEATAQFDPVLAAVFARAPQLQRATALTAQGDAWSAWVTRQWSPTARWRFNLGLRFDAQRYDARDAGAAGAAATTRLSDQQWSPRLAAEFLWKEGTILRASAGRATQSERPDELMVADGESRFHAPQRADQLVLGVEQRIGTALQLRIEAYRKDVDDPLPRYENLFDPLTVLPELEVDRRRVAPQSSRLYGIEGSLRWQPADPWSGWFGYTWSEAKDQFDGFSAPRSWNQLHSLFAGVSWTQAPWQLSANLIGHSGWRRNGFDASTTGSAAGLGLELAPRNAGAWAPFVSLDLRASWRRPLPRGALRVFGEINNLTNRSNPCCEKVSVGQSGAGAALITEPRNWLPRYALIGAAWELP